MVTKKTGAKKPGAPARDKSEQSSTPDLFDDDAGQPSETEPRAEPLEAAAVPDRSNPVDTGGAAAPITGEDTDADHLVLAHYAERAYLDYAVSVVKGRALPEVCDGLKPVQRRLLYSMDQMGLGPNAKPVKSARVVGDVLGKFHPHGDSSAYDALVRLAQDFSQRYPLIDGQGNFGSRDGDGAAAMRYTEARLTKFAQLLLDEINEGTVDFVANYDGSYEEPKLLPARLPMVLLNGASGIAVGLATEIPPHNLREVARAAVALIKQPKTELAELMTLLPGPDFPGGGQIINPAGELAEIYANGRGSVKVRARYKIEDLARGQWQLVVTELPHGSSTRQILEEIEELNNPKVKLGKKSLSAEQVGLKQKIGALLDKVRDESGKDAAVRLIIEPRTSKIDQQELIHTLLAHTSLESSVPVNLVVIGRDGRPRQQPLVTILREWIDYRVDTVTRRTQFRLQKVNDRIHILEGRQIVLLNIDKVIKIIRESDEPKPALIQAFKLSDRQAEDILEIRLRQLARLEAIKIETEMKSLVGDRKSLEALLASPAAMRKQIIGEIEADAKAYGDDRRTLIESAERAVVETKVPDEPVTVIVSQGGWLRARQGHGHDASQFTFKSGDALSGAYQVRTTDMVYAVSTSGRSYSVPVSSLPSARGDGVPVTTLIELESGARVEHVFAAASDMGVLLASRGGFGMICQAADLQTRIRNGKQFMALETADSPIRPALFEPGMTQLLCVSAQGKALLFGIDQVKVLKSGGRGVTLIGLDDDDELSAVMVVDQRGATVHGTAHRGGKPRAETFTLRRLEEWRGARARKGKFLEPRLKQARLFVPGDAQ